jgi:hypothetical protein
MPILAPIRTELEDETGSSFRPPARHSRSFARLESLAPPRD